MQLFKTEQANCDLDQQGICHITMKHPSSSLRAGPKNARPGTAGPQADGNDVTASANDGLRRAGACAHIHNYTANLGNTKRQTRNSKKIFFFLKKKSVPRVEI